MDVAPSAWRATRYAERSCWPTTNPSGPVSAPAGAARPCRAYPVHGALVPASPPRRQEAFQNISGLNPPGWRTDNDAPQGRALPARLHNAPLASEHENRCSTFGAAQFDLQPIIQYALTQVGNSNPTAGPRRCYLSIRCGCKSGAREGVTDQIFDCGNAAERRLRKASGPVARIQPLAAALSKLFPLGSFW